MVAGYIGDAGDALAASGHWHWIANGKMFTAADSDNDLHGAYNCGTMGGWWHSACSASLLNKDADGGWTTGTPTNDMRASRMLVKLN